MNSFKIRRETREVIAGNVVIGGKKPVQVQSMTSTPTSDTVATVGQILRIVSAGAAMVRMTVQNIKEAENLNDIRSELHRQGCFVPLVADVHFNPAIAETAAAIVEKVRINPGNYGISRGRTYTSLSDEAYNEELSIAKSAFVRLIDICRNNGTALRIGVNHGSLSPRIIYRYGNTPEGMARSAMEFLRFCKEENFHNVVVSLKSSNTVVMVKSNRLIVEYMTEAGMNYPLHLGVTEAGEGEDGRIRSVTGIGTLLTEGIGDTIRVSLTEDPEEEIPVARKLMDHINIQRTACQDQDTSFGRNINTRKHELSRRSVPVKINGDANKSVPGIGGDYVPVVISSFSEPGPDYIFSSATSELRSNISTEKSGSGGYPLLNGSNYLAGASAGSGLVFLQASLADLSVDLLEKVSGDKRVVFIAVCISDCPPVEMRHFISVLQENKCTNPVIFKKTYRASADIDSAQIFQIAATADFAPLFIDRAGDGLWLEYLSVSGFSEPAGSSAPYATDLSGEPGESILRGLSQIAGSTAFSILQSARARITRTEFISCPSCGRTMFNIQKATAGVKERLSHLQGLKIAVMGCIVNGPGEMVDADYGYVGSGRGKVTLYKKQEVVKRNVPEEHAVDELINLIKENGDWQ